MHAASVNVPGSIGQLQDRLDTPTVEVVHYTADELQADAAQLAGAAGLAAGGLSDSNMVGTAPPVRVDMKGVAFNADYCSEAKDPFYSSGPNQGQWKCRRGVPGATYDHWYSNELAALSLNAPAAEPAPLDVSQAFAGPATTAAPAVTNTAAPTDCGKLMVWVSEQQVAGNITPEQVHAAYTRHNLTLADMFPPNTPDVIAARVALIYGDLA